MKRLVAGLAYLLLWATPTGAQVQEWPVGVTPPVIVVSGGYVTGNGVAYGPILFPDGTAGAPSIAFASEPTLGFWRSSATNVTVQGSFTATANLIGTNAVVTPVVALSPTLFSGLGAPSNGIMLYCSDCTVTTPATCPGTQASCVCTGSGSGAIARRINSTWYCTP